MTDRQIYERALAELQRCEERAEELRAFMRVYEEFADLTTAKKVVPARTAKARGTTDVEMQDWEKMVDSAIRRAGQAMRVREIYEAIVPMGFHVDSKNPVNALTTKLARSPHFTRPGRGLYTVGEKPAAEGASSLPTRQEASTDDESDDEGLTSRQEKGAAADELPYSSWEQAAKGS